MTTKTHKGKTYEIGKLYEFSDGDGFAKTHTIKSILKDVDSEPYPFCTYKGNYAFCREMNPESLGKITKAKIEPESGKVYKVSGDQLFDYILWYEGTTLAAGCEIICEMVEKTEGEE